MSACICYTNYGEDLGTRQWLPDKPFSVVLRANKERESIGITLLSYDAALSIILIMEGRFLTVVIVRLNKRSKQVSQSTAPSCVTKRIRDSPYGFVLDQIFRAIRCLWPLKWVRIALHDEQNPGKMGLPKFWNMVILMRWEYSISRCSSMIKERFVSNHPD